MELTTADELVEHLVEFYDRTAKDYDAWASGLHAKVAERLVAVAEPAPGENVLDVGCGTGLVTHLLADRVGRKGSVVGIDLSAAMLDQARARPRKIKGNVNFQAMEAEQLIFRAGSFDLITYGQSLPYLVDPIASLDEAVRLLKPGGRIALSLHRRSLHTEAQEVFYRSLGALAERHFLTVPRHSSERAVLSEKGTIERLLDEMGFTDIRHTEMVTGGTARTPRDWTELMAGTGPLPHTLIKVLGERPRAAFEAELVRAMEPLGEEAFRYHFAFLFVVGRLRP